MSIDANSCELRISVEFMRGNVARYTRFTTERTINDGDFLINYNEIMSIDSVESFLQKFAHGKLYLFVDSEGIDIDARIEQTPTAYLEEYRINREIFLSEIELYSIYSMIRCITVEKTYLNPTEQKQNEKCVKIMLGV